MKRIGTDVLALACIAGGAGLSAATTLAFADVSEVATLDCAVEVVESQPRVVVALSGSESVVVASSVRIHTEHGCARAADGEAVRIQERRVRERTRQAQDWARVGQERARRAQDRVRVQVERARVRLDDARVRIRGVEQIEVEERLHEVEVELDETFEIQIERRLEDETRRLQELLRRLDDEVGT